MNQPGPQNSNTSRPFFRRRDLLFVLGALLLAAALWAATALFKTPGAVAEVTVGLGPEQAVTRYALGEDRTLHIDAALPVTLIIEGGTIRFADSVCPDHDCERFGRLAHEGDWAACLPAGVTVRVVEE